MLQQLTTLSDHRLLAFAIARGEHRATIGRRLPLPRREAAIAFACDLCSLRIEPVQIGEDRGTRPADCLDVESMETRAAVRLHAFIVPPEPINEFRHFGIAPHPCRDTLKGQLALCGCRAGTPKCS